MQTLAFFSVLGAFAFILWSLFGVVFASGRRRRRIRQAGIGCIALFAALIFLVLAGDNKAREAGFESVADQSAAEKAGITDPRRWSAQKEEIARQASEAAALAAKELAARERKEAEELEARRREEAAAAAAAQAEEERKNKAAEAACLADLNCIWKEQSIDIAVNCRISVQALAKWDYEWTDGLTTGPAFMPAGWHKKEEGSITVMGSQLKLQNGFGAWKKVSYLCAYDPKEKRAIEAAVVQ